jgi:hypothetical protein
MKTTREWIPPLWLALVLACTTATIATIAAFTVDARAASVPGAIAIVLFVAAFRHSGRATEATDEPERIEASMLDVLMPHARSLAPAQPPVMQQQIPSAGTPRPPADDEPSETPSFV